MRPRFHRSFVDASRTRGSKDRRTTSFHRFREGSTREDPSCAFHSAPPSDAWFVPALRNPTSFGNNRCHFDREGTFRSPHRLRNHFEHARSSFLSSESDGTPCETFPFLVCAVPILNAAVRFFSCEPDLGLVDSTLDLFLSI